MRHNTLHLIAIVVALTVIAVVPRFHDLDAVGFFGDEQLTAMVSRSIATGDGPKMPSGMLYVRGLPLSYLVALSSEILGPETESSYRVPAALFGALTVPLLFLLAWPLVGRNAALIAALMLALSDWHIVTSRQARMYAPYMFFIAATAFAAWYSARCRRAHPALMAAAAGLFCATVFFHQLGLFAVLVVPIPIALMGWGRVPPWRYLVFAAVGFVVARQYNGFVGGAFRRWFASQSSDAYSPGIEDVSFLSNLQFPPSVPAALVGASIGVVLGLWAAHLGRYDDQAVGAGLRRIAHYALGAAAGGFAGAAQLHAAGLAALLLLVQHPERGITVARRLRLPAVGIALLALGWGVVTIVRSGPLDGLKQLFGFPYPYLWQLGGLFPGVVLLFVGTTLYLALQPHSDRGQALRLNVLATLLPLSAMGAVLIRGETRYLIGAYPFILLVAAAGLVESLTWIGRRTGRWDSRGALIAALFVVASGVLGGHGLPQAWRQASPWYGEHQAYRNPYFYPDHAGAGRYIREHRKPGDVVVAENALRQRWYTGEVDYWLRRPAVSSEVFVARDGEFRDLYMNLVIPTAETLDKLGRDGRRVWIVTSAERWKNYSSADQMRWLNRIEQSNEPVFAGRDGVTKVYCVDVDVSG